MKRLMYAILSVLDSQIESMNSVRIATELGSQGVNLSERTVRYYLQMLDARGFTAAQGRKGRKITDTGKRELSHALVSEPVSFSLQAGRGTSCWSVFDELKQTTLCDTMSAIR